MSRGSHGAHDAARAARHHAAKSPWESLNSDPEESLVVITMGVKIDGSARDSAVADAVHQTSEPGVDLEECSLKKFLFYRTPKSMLVMVWQLGLLHRLCQVGLLVYVLYTIFVAAQWAKSLPVTNTVNAWAGSGGAAAVAESGRAYCGQNVSYDYDYGGGWTYTEPECRRVQVDSISVKLPDRVFITTMFTETVSVGWACSDPQHAPNTAACRGTPILDGPQCGCRTRQTVFPIGVEDMTVSFQHAYHAAEADFPLRGDSNLAVPTDGVLPLHTDFEDVFPNVSTLAIASGTPITFRLSDWLLMANVSLDQLNTLEPPDAREGVHRHPFFRTTGVSLEVDLEYSNKNWATDVADVAITTIGARVRVGRAAGWAGVGAAPDIHVTLPTDATPHTYHTISRYRQGVLFNFRGRGLYYHFDLVTVVMALVTGAVLLGAATTIVDTVSLNLYRCAL